MYFLFKNYPLVKVIYLLIKSVDKIQTQEEIARKKQRERNREKERRGRGGGGETQRERKRVGGREGDSER